MVYVCVRVCVCVLGVRVRIVRKLLAQYVGTLTHKHA
jgi:hypothetical protein